MNNNNIQPLNDNHLAHGLWVGYYFNGNLGYKCFWDNGDPLGYEENYYYDNVLTYKQFHLN